MPVQKKLVNHKMIKHFSCQHGLEKISGVVGYRGNIPNNPDANLGENLGRLLLSGDGGCRILGIIDELDLAD
jgi:hypothetical protein